MRRPLGRLCVALASVSLIAWTGVGVSRPVSATRFTAAEGRALLLSPHGNGLIAFTSNRQGNQDILVMNPDGSAQTNVTNDPGSDFLPAWTPDGTRIAFVSSRTGNSEIFTMNADGSGQKNMSNNGATDTQPAWAPDRTKIAFVSNRTGNNDIFVMNPNGSGQTNLTNDGGSDTHPAWAPDRTKIAFVSNRAGNSEVFVMNADGSGQVNLSSNAATDTQPAWAPDGEKIAFVSNRTGNNEIFVMNADGSGQLDLSNSPTTPDTEPVYSPDAGTRIAFTSIRGGNSEILVMDSLDGSDQTRISHNSASETSPDWQPLPARPPIASPLDHFVIIDMENHTFDNVLGKLCVQSGRCDGASTGELQDGTIIDLAKATDIVPVVAHTPFAQDAAVAGGLMNGFSTISGCEADTGYACYSQFDKDQIPNLWALAEAFAISDRTFQQDSINTWGSHLELVSSVLNGFESPGPFGQGGPGWGCDSLDDAGWHATKWDPLVNMPSCIPAMDGTGPYRPSPVPWVPTIMNRLDQAGLTWRIYGGVPGEPGLGYHLSICPSFAECLYGPQRPSFVQRDQFLADAANGTLPSLSIITPAEVDSQHNNDSMMAGDNWIAEQLGAVMNGPQWDTSAVFITYDDCGCFYDHVPPPPGLGIRIPMVVVSPYAKAGFTDSRVASFASMLALVEHVFGLAPLSSEDAAAYDYSQSFDWNQQPLGPIALETHEVPAWELEWIRAHPSDPADPT